MKQFDHPNIVGLVGAYLDTLNGFPCLILPFVVNGNIQEYLKDACTSDKHCNSSRCVKVLNMGVSIKILVTMCADVMEYLL